MEDEIRVVKISKLESHENWKTVIDAIRAHRVEHYTLSPGTAILILKNPSHLDRFTRTIFERGITSYELHSKENYDCLVEQEEEKYR
jgi:hypothetical protein